MSNEGTWISDMRAAARRALPEGARILRDRKDALFITDAAVGYIPGFLVRARGGMRALDPDDTWFEKIERADTPLDDLARSLQRFRGIPPTEAARRLLVAGLKLSDTRASDAQIAGFDKGVRRLAAAALRTGDGGGIFALAVLDARIKNCYNIYGDIGNNLERKNTGGG